MQSDWWRTLDFDTVVLDEFGGPRTHYRAREGQEILVTFEVQDGLRTLVIVLREEPK